MYVYFNAQGVLKEIINDEYLRQGSSGINTIYVYFENLEHTSGDSATIIFEDGTTRTLTYQATKSPIPSNQNRDMKYFIDGKKYNWWTYTLDSTILAKSGLRYATVRYTTNSETINVQGVITFMVEASNVSVETNVAASQVAYLLDVLLRKDFSNIDVLTDDTTLNDKLLLKNAQGTYQVALSQLLSNIALDSVVEYVDEAPVTDDGKVRVLSTDGSIYVGTTKLLDATLSTKEVTTFGGRLTTLKLNNNNTYTIPSVQYVTGLVGTWDFTTNGTYTVGYASTLIDRDAVICVQLSDYVFVSKEVSSTDVEFYALYYGTNKVATLSHTSNTFTLVVADDSSVSYNGAVSTILNDDLTPNYVLVSNPLGKVASSSILENTLEYLSNATGNIQQQLNGKQPLITSSVPLNVDLVNGAVKVSDIVDNVTSTATNKPLSAKQGKVLQDQISNIGTIGRFLSMWNCTTGLPATNPSSDPYTYQAGDYYIVSNVGTTNYKPNGSTYTANVASTTVETNTVSSNDIYRYDGNNWTLLHSTGDTVSFASLVGEPSDNTNLASALNAKQDVIDSDHKLSSDLVDDTNATNKFVTAAEKLYYASKLGTGSCVNNLTSTSIQAPLAANQGKVLNEKIPTLVTDSSGKVVQLTVNGTTYDLKATISSITLTSATTSGTITTGQVTALAGNTDNYVILNDQKYSYQEEGLYTYVNASSVKTFNVSLDNLTWSLTETLLIDNLSASNNQIILSSGSTQVATVNVKTINNTTLLGTGDIAISGGSSNINTIDIDETSTTIGAAVSTRTGSIYHSKLSYVTSLINNNTPLTVVFSITHATYGVIKAIFNEWTLINGYIYSNVYIDPNDTVQIQIRLSTTTASGRYYYASNKGTIKASIPNALYYTNGQVILRHGANNIGSAITIPVVQKASNYYTKEEEVSRGIINNLINDTPNVTNFYFQYNNITYKLIPGRDTSLAFPNTLYCLYGGSLVWIETLMTTLGVGIITIHYEYAS